MRSGTLAIIPPYAKVGAVLRVTLISHSESYYSTRRLLEAGRQLGHEMARVDPVRVVLRVSGDRGGPSILEDGQVHPVPDVVMPRIGAMLGAWSRSLLEAWIIQGARSAIAPEAIAIASDKVLATLRLTAAGVPTVPTLTLREPFHVESVLDELPGEAWVIKSRTGTGGNGVVMATGRPSARSVLSALTARHDTVLVQPYLSLGPARDLRVLVAGMEPLAAYWREADGDEFRTNVHRGARARPVPLDAAPEGALDTALAAARTLSLPFSGVDLIETGDGLAVLEVNASPGFEGAEEATGLDLATPFVQRWVAWPSGGTP